MVDESGYLDPGRPDYCGRCATSMVLEWRGGRTRQVCPSCGWVYYAKPALGSAVLLEQGEKVLLVRRAHEPFRGWWMLPAGFVEYGEYAADTAVREAREEIGVDIEVAGLFGVYFGTDDPRNVAHLVVYTARIVKGDLRPGDDAVEVRAFAPGELPEHIAFHAHRQALAEWAARWQPRARVP